MVGSNGSQLDRYLDHDHHHQLMDGRAGNHSVPTSSEFSCSICLDLVSDTGGRSRAKLQCGHEFHLDCIGSAFNMKGAMQCPNCRKVEKGRWWYANGSTRSLPELSTEDWHLDYNYYDPVYSEMPFRAQWCPFGEFTRTASSSEEVESPSTTYHEIHEQHAAALRSFNGELDAFTRPRSFPHPFPFEYGSRGGSSFVSSVIPRHPGSGAHTYDRIQVSLAYYRQQHRFNQQHFNRPGVPAPVVPGMRRGLAPVAPAILQPDQSGSFYIYPPSSSSGQNLHEAESFNPNNCSALVRERLSHFPIVSRVSGWGSYHPTSRSDSGHRSRSFIHWHFA
ncbi:E3 ubiquitin-protein ligase RFI2-like isoform X4 [Durio zibethinus]|uniref:E3 ubiquitin-protein ligase RFI2-like isoform X4 n=1 Tax=Durio zibethinus TaxID=66656 RepID=A0A6P6B1H5_DURZI|nr:E3 ubiquitin-protein ligase RFI2-like isoform X4 [Durio zibethinus]